MLPLAELFKSIKTIEPLLYVKPFDLIKDPLLIEKKLEITKIVCSGKCEGCNKTGQITFRTIKKKNCITFKCKDRMRIFYAPTPNRTYWLYTEVRKHERKPKN